MYHDFFGLREAPFRITPNTGFFFAGGADESALLHARHVVGIGAGVIAAGPFFLIELDENALGTGFVGERFLFRFGAVAPVNPGRPGQGGDLFDPGDKTGMACGGRMQARDCGIHHCYSPEHRPAICATVALPCVKSRNVSAE
jgi:hypothetical protein